MVRVVIMAESIVMRAGLSTLLTEQPDIAVVGSLALTDGDRVDALQAEVVVLEFPETLMAWEGERSPNLSEDWKDGMPGVPIVALCRRSSVGMVSAMVPQHIRGLLPLNISAEELAAAVVAVSVGLVVIHPELLPELLAPEPPIEPSLESLLEPPIALPTKIDLTHPLSQRELEVLGMLAAGMGNKAIAQQLTLSEHTVKFHLASIFTKLQVSSRTEAVTLALRRGWIAL